jgi:hypothetical protein
MLGIAVPAPADVGLNPDNKGQSIFQGSKQILV